MSSGILRSLVVNVVANAKPLERSFAGLTSTVGGFVAKVGALTGGVFAVSEAFQGLAESDEAIARLDAVVAATGQAAGLTSQQIQGMASALQQTTTFADDVTISAAAVMAGFKNIKGDNFRVAMVAAQDMATVMGGDLQSSVMQISKALNDPVQGLSALSKAGVTFSDEQKKMIADMVAMNDVAGAQKIILQELASEFGGAAAAEAATFSGQVKQMKLALGDLAEAMAAKVQPAISVVVASAKQLAVAIQSIQFNSHAVQALKYAAAIGLAVVLAPKIVAACMFIKRSIDAIRTAQITMLAFAGPKGWAQIAIGVAVAGAAVYAVNQMFDETAANAKTSAAATAAQAQANQALAASAGVASTAGTSLVTSLKEQVATFGLEGRALEIRKAQLAGMTKSTREQVDVLSRQLQSLEANEKAAEDFAKAQEEMKSQADAVRESLKSPLDEQADKLKKLDALVQSGALSWADYAAAKDKANADFISNMKGGATAPRNSPSAIEAGSAAMFQKIADARGVQESQKIQEKQLAALDKLVQLSQQNSGGTSQEKLAVANF